MYILTLELAFLWLKFRNIEYLFLEWTDLDLGSYSILLLKNYKPTFIHSNSNAKTSHSSCFYIPKCQLNVNETEERVTQILYFVFILEAKGYFLLFISFFLGKNTQIPFQSKTHLFLSFLWTLLQLKVHYGTYAVSLLTKYKHFIDLLFLRQCQSTGSYSLLFHSCLSLDSNKVGLSDNAKHEHHFFPIYSHRVPSLQVYFKLNMTGDLPTFFFQWLSSK